MTTTNQLRLLAQLLGDLLIISPTSIYKRSSSSECQPNLNILNATLTTLLLSLNDNPFQVRQVRGKRLNSHTVPTTILTLHRMKFLLFAMFTALVSANPALKTYARDSAELHHLEIRQNCAYSICQGGCGTCYQNTNVCCPRDINQSCFQFSC